MIGFLDGNPGPSCCRAVYRIVQENPGILKTARFEPSTEE